MEPLGFVSTTVLHLYTSRPGVSHYYFILSSSKETSLCGDACTLLVRYTNVGTVQVPGTTVTIYLRMYRSVLMKQVSF